MELEHGNPNALTPQLTLPSHRLLVSSNRHPKANFTLQIPFSMSALGICTNRAAIQMTRALTAEPDSANVGEMPSDYHGNADFLRQFHHLG